jgi:hypothetical protein
MKLKYVRSRIGWVIFAPHIAHKSMIHSLEETPTHAGFCQLSPRPDGGVVVSCYGGSVSLGLEAGLDDSEWLTDKLNSYY